MIALLPSLHQFRPQEVNDLNYSLPGLAYFPCLLFAICNQLINGNNVLIFLGNYGNVTFEKTTYFV